MDHAYSAEQKAYHDGLVNRVVQATTEYAEGQRNCDPKLIMGHYDGNTVAALWTYAQHFALNDNSFGTMFGPSTPGALNLFAAQTAGADQHDLPNETIGGNVISDAEPQFDDCAKKPKITISNVRTIGDLLSERGLSWGWFQGGYRPTKTASENGGKARCEASHKNAAGADVRDYSPHHNPVAYYVQFKNSQHLPPTSVDMIGRSDQAMHQYDLDDFWRAVDNASMPAVSFVKAAAYAGWSRRLFRILWTSRRGSVNTINTIMQSLASVDAAPRSSLLMTIPTVGTITSCGPILTQSEHAETMLSRAPAHCGTGTGSEQGRCGYGPRLPLLAISPYSKVNYVDHTVTDQSSILRFIEDNWGLPRLGDGAMDQWAGSLVAMFDFGTPARTDLLILDPETGIQAMRGCLPSPALHARRVGRHRRRADCDEP